MNNEDKILQLLLEIKSDVDQLKQGQTNLELSQLRLQTDLDQLKQGQAHLQTDIDEIKTHVKYIWEDISRQEKRIEKLAR